MSATSSGIPAPQHPHHAAGQPPQLNQLCLAASKGDNETIRGLVNNGAKFDPDENGRSALHYAANYGQTVTVKLCLQLGCQLDIQDKHGCTALHRAVLDGQIDTVKVLLYEGCSVDRQDENGNTALHEAAWGGYSKVLDLLIKRGKAHIHASNKHGHKPIHLACQNGHNESTRLLLRGGGNPNTKNNNGDTPVHVSSLFGHITCLRILISAGCNINVKNKDGNTPLHVAAGLGKAKITRVLLEAKCDVNVRNNADLTAVEMARRNNHAEIVLVILSAHRLWRGSMSQRKPRKNKSSKENSKKKHTQDKDEDDDVDGGHPARVKGRREIKGEEASKRLDARKKTEERILMNENYDKWRELQGVLLKKELQKQADIRGHKHGKALTSSHSDCKVCIQKLENQIEASKEKMMFELETAKACFEHKLRKMDRKIVHQGACMDRLCQERVKAEATACLHRIDKRAIEERAAWAEENDVRLDLVKDDLRGWVEGKLREVQRQLKVLDERGENGGVTKLRVRSKSESDLGTIDSTTEMDDTDGDDMEGIVIGRGRDGSAVEEMVGDEEEIDGDEVDSGGASGGIKYGVLSIKQTSPLHRSRPVMRGRNVRTGKYGKQQVTIGRSRSLDSSQISASNDACHLKYDSDHSSCEDDQSEDDTGAIAPRTDFSRPTYGSVSDETKSKIKTEVQGTDEDGSDRGRSSQRATTQNKRTSSFTRAVQHEMWAAAQASAAANDSSDGSVRALVEGTYRPPIVVVTDPHRMGSYSSGADGIQPANLSSADEDSEETLSITSSEESLVTVSRLTLDSPATLSPHASVDQQHSRQAASGQSESSPSASQSSASPGDSANNKPPRSDCSKSSSGISSGASTTYSQHHNNPIDDIVGRASSLNDSALNRWSLSRSRPSRSRDVPPTSQDHSNRHGPGQYSAMPQQYVTSKSAYSAQQQLSKTQRCNTQPGQSAVEQLRTYSQKSNDSLGHYQSGRSQPRQTSIEQHPTSNQQSTSVPGHAQSSHTQPNKQTTSSNVQSSGTLGHAHPRQTMVVQPPAFKSSKSSQPMAGGAAVFAARSSPSHPRAPEHSSALQHGQIPQQQKQLQQQQPQLLHQKHPQPQKQLHLPSHKRYNQGPVSQPGEPVEQSYNQVPPRQHGLASHASLPMHQTPADVVPNRSHVVDTHGQQHILPSGHRASSGAARQDNTISVTRAGQLLRYHQIGSLGSTSYGSTPQPMKQSAAGQSTVVAPRVSNPETNRNNHPVRSTRPVVHQVRPHTSQKVPSPQISTSKPVVPRNTDNGRNDRPIVQQQQTRPHTLHTVPFKAATPSSQMALSTSGVQHHSDKADSDRLFTKQTRTLASHTVPFQPAMPSGQKPTAVHGIAEDPPRHARPLNQPPRSQETHPLPLQPSVPSSITHKSSAANSQSRMPDPSSRPALGSSQPSASDSSSTTSSGSRKTVVRRTYEISL